MRKTYKLKKGAYYVGDPAMITLKNDLGEAFLQKLFEVFYKAPNEFQDIKIKGIHFFAQRTEGGDGIFNGVGTDTGIYIILNTKYLTNKKLFKQTLPPSNYKIIAYDHDTFVSVESFNIYFEDFEIITS